jgi:hypothetical protein
MTDRTLHLCRAAFERWRGGDAEFIELRRSARTAFFAVTVNGKKFALHCLDPQRVEANIHWSNCDLTVELQGDEPWFVVADVRAGVRIVCGAVSVGDAPGSWS